MISVEFLTMKSVIGDWSYITRITMVMLHVSIACRQGDRACQMTCSQSERERCVPLFAGGYQGNILMRDITQVVCCSLHTRQCKQKHLIINDDQIIINNHLTVLFWVISHRVDTPEWVDVSSDVRMGLVHQPDDTTWAVTGMISLCLMWNPSGRSRQPWY